MIRRCPKCGKNFVVLKGGRPVFQQAGLARQRQMQEWLRAAGA